MPLIKLMVLSPPGPQTFIKVMVLRPGRQPGQPGWLSGWPGGLCRLLYSTILLYSRILLYSTIPGYSTRTRCPEGTKNMFIEKNKAEGFVQKT